MEGLEEGGREGGREGRSEGEERLTYDCGPAKEKEQEGGRAGTGIANRRRQRRCFVCLNAGLAQGLHTSVPFELPTATEYFFFNAMQIVQKQAQICYQAFNNFDERDIT